MQRLSRGYRSKHKVAREERRGKSLLYPLSTVLLPGAPFCRSDQMSGQVAWNGQASRRRRPRTKVLSVRTKNTDRKRSGKRSVRKEQSLAHRPSIIRSGQRVKALHRFRRSQRGQRTSVGPAVQPLTRVRAPDVRRGQAASAARPVSVSGRSASAPHTGVKSFRGR